MSVAGNITLFLALAASLYAAILYLVGARGENRKLVDSGRAGLLLAGGLVTLSVIILLVALLTHNFQLSYVASYTSRATSLAYIVTALWAGNDGSMLFWAWLVAVFAVVLVLGRGSRNLVPYAAGIMMLVQAFFLILLMAAANPFDTLAVAPADGRGLNPMLENPGMILHPPALLAGYVALTVPFAFGIAALLKGRPGNDWLAAARGWALLAWLLLGVGNIIGAWWAYVELGWGGYWAWDPVENAGLMPWLIVTAFLHSVMVQRRRGMFKIWSMALIIFAFSLAIFGTYINRSGVLSSVHTYGESAMGPLFLAFLIIIVVGSLGLLYYRRGSLKSEAEVDALASREGTFLLNNILLVGITAVIFFGTVFPGIAEAVRGVRIEVGRGFFDRVSPPVFLGIILLIGLCTLIGWRSVTTRKFLRDLAWPAAGAFILSVILFILGVRAGYAVVGGFICGLVFLAIFFRWYREANEFRREGENVLSAGGRLFRAARSRYGGYIVHLSILLMAVGVIGSSVYDVSRDVVIPQGGTASIGGYTLVYQGLTTQETPDKQIVTATLEVYNGERQVATVRPEQYYHRSFEQPVSEVAIRTTPLEDLYVILAGWDASGTASFTLLVEPLVVWLWIGGGVFLAGGIIAFWPGRRRETTAEEAGESVKIEDEIEQRVRQLRHDRGMVCPRCGAPHKAGDRFCGRCGARLNKV